MRARASCALFAPFVALAACGKHDPPAPTPARRTPPVSADIRNLLPPPPAGFTPCSSDMGPGVDDVTAKARQAAWRTKARPATSSFRRANVVSARGGRRAEDDVAPPEPPRMTFGLPAATLSVTLPTRTLAIETSARGIVASSDDGPADEVFRHVVGALLAGDALVGLSSGWDARGDRPGDLTVRVYLLGSPFAALADALERRGEPAMRDVACSSEESGFHRAAWRVERETRSDGTRWQRVSSTISLSGCTPGGVVHVETHAKAVPHATLVIACTYGEHRHEEHCAEIARSLRVETR